MSALTGWIQGIELTSLALGLLDILIVTVLIYRVLLLIRGTRAAYMLIGLLSVVGVYLLARQLSLRTVGWLLDHLISYSLLIVIIVFQSDLRRGLLRVGRRLVNPRRAALTRSQSETLACACEALASRSTGALIVIEREMDVAEQVEAGTPLDALLTEQLLATLFVAVGDNPLHDGAVVLRGDRLTRAGVLLPLSRSSSLDGELGTRHRAALGITEETDALALVVSEERGTISLCHGGRLERDLERFELRRRLQELLGDTPVVPRAPTFLERAARYLVVGDDAERRRDKKERRVLSTCREGGVGA